MPTPRTPVDVARERLETTQAMTNSIRRTGERLHRNIDQQTATLSQYLREAALFPPEYSTQHLADLQELWRGSLTSLAQDAGLVAAYEVVAAAHRVALGAAHLEEHPAPAHKLAELAPASPVAHAVNYTAIHSEWRGGSWAAENSVILPADRVEEMLDTWSRVLQAHILRDATGTYTVATPDNFIQLCPLEEPTPKEGDVLRAALTAYVLPSSPMWECGINYLVVPLDITATGDRIHTGPRLFITSDEDIERPVDAHDAPWTVSLHDADGEYIQQIYSSPKHPMGIAEECVHCAKSVAAWLRDHVHEYLKH
ncbi:hypothetical protein ACWCQQ_32970 [Streptomyces sp. NPDC002143]